MALSVEELIEKARDQRHRDRHAEAVITSRLATEQEPDNPKAWWELGLSLVNTDDLPGAEEAFEQLTELAPGFALGWEYLGLVLSDQGREDESVMPLEAALELGTKSKAALRILSRRYAEKENKAGEYVALKRMHELGFLETSFQWNRLGILHYENAHYHDALIAYRKCASFKEDPASLFNMGLVYTNPEISQDVDAIDMWRLVLHRYPGQLDRAQKQIDALLPRLLTLARNAQAVGLSLLDPEQWYSVYLSPFELLNVHEHLDVDGPEGLDALDAKTLQRLKKQLLAEIDLEEGRISWLGNHVVDRSRAIALCDELNDERKKLAHWQVFQEPPLLDFLSRGEHGLFTIDAKRSPIELLELLEDTDDPFVRWLSPLFTRQYNTVLGKAIERRSLPVIEALFDGRRWVLPEHSDECFEAARRQVAPLLQPLRDAAEAAEKAKPVLATIEKLTQGEAVAILNLLPTPFREQQNEAAQLLRSISIAAHNVHGDSDVATSVLELTRNFHFKSATLNHQLQEDYQTLRDIIKEQRKYEAHLTSGDQEWKITKDLVQLGHRRMPTDSIQALNWGMTLDNGGCEFYMAFLDLKADELSFTWRATKDLAKQEEHFKNLLHAAFAYVVPQVIQRIEANLKAGKPVFIGPCRLTQAGVHFERQGWFTSKQCLVPWSQVTTKLQSGQVIVSDRNTPKNNISLSIRHVKNAPILHFMAGRTENA